MSVRFNFWSGTGGDITRLRGLLTLLQRHTMQLRYVLFFMLFMPFEHAAHAQQAIYSGANRHPAASTLPMRNLQIEVRQISRDDAQNDAFRTGGQVRLGPGHSSAQLDATASSATRSREAQAQQQVMVLNGRRAGIALRNSQPLRLVQTFVINGVMTAMPGTVLIESGTGFDATARWDGGAQVELDLSASQGQGRDHIQASGTTTLVVIPLNEWVTIAQSADGESGARAGFGGADRRTRDSTFEVQVRVNLR